MSSNSIPPITYKSSIFYTKINVNSKYLFTLLVILVLSILIKTDNTIFL